jgi:uncharacterized protein YecT (DUF1311 family)
MIVRFPSLLLLFALFFSSACSRAMAQHMNAPGVPCNRPSSTVQEANCFARASDAADKELNNFYGRVRSVLTPEEQKDLMKAQRAWVKYRDLTCIAEYNLYGGGTGGPVTQMACLSAVTQERVATLRITYGWRIEK